MVSENESQKFDELYLKYATLVFKLSLKYSGYVDDRAVDMAQLAFLELYDQMEGGLKLSEIDNFPSYMYTIVKNLSLNTSKKTSKECFIEDVPVYDRPVMEVEPSVEDSYIHQVDEILQYQKVQLILRELERKNEVWYKVVTEVFYKGRSQIEVAEELGMSDTAIYAMIHRIRRWANKHRLQFEQDAENTLEEVSEGHLYLH